MSSTTLPVVAVSTVSKVVLRYPHQNMMGFALGSPHPTVNKKVSSPDTKITDLSPLFISCLFGSELFQLPLFNYPIFLSCLFGSEPGEHYKPLITAEYLAHAAVH